MASKPLSGWPPPSERWPVPNIHCRTLLPIYPPPEEKLRHPPSLPSPPRAPLIHPSFRLSTHLVPAAYLRTTRYVPPPPESMMPDPKAPRETVKKAKELKRWLEDAKGSEIEGKNGYEMVLWNCVNRYYKIGKEKKGKGLTLFFAHAVGFTKEIWEPTLRHLLASSSDIIDEVWAWEAVQHGDAGLVNEGNLSYLYDWIDNGRDILNFFTYFIPTSATTDILPVHLPCVPESVSKQRSIQGLRERQIVAIGHSFGGCTSALAALTNPNLFSSLILVDPVILRPLWPAEYNDYTAEYVLGAILRRTAWKSKSEALALLKQVPFFSVWDPEVLEVYIECALHAAQDAKGNELVKLKMPGLQEAVVFTSTYTQQEVYVRFHTLDEGIKLKWVMPGRTDPDDIMGPAGSTQQRVWLRPVNSSNVRIPTAGHLVAHETPKELAEEIQTFIHEAYCSVPKARL